MKNEFYVWIMDFNGKNLVPYDILPYLSQEWGELKPGKKKEASKDLRGWVDSKLKYQFWSRCQYEMLVLPWPPGPKDSSKKVDVYDQCVPNLDLITRLFAENERIN